MVENKSIIYLSFIILSFIGCSDQTSKWIEVTHPEVEYTGRIASNDSLNAKVMFWPGSSVKINYEGTSLSALIEDERGENYFNIIINNDSIYVLNTKPSKNKYLLCDLDYGKHTITIFKRTEWDRGRVAFYGFEIGKNGEILKKDIPKERKIEFYGNSITAGYGIEDYSGNDSPDSIFTNNYLAYGALIARHYNAQYHCIARGGIGIMISWFPLVMPDIYDRINPYDPESKWDFQKYQADIVIINLFQNDSWLVNMIDHDSFRSTFGKQKPDEMFIINSYKKFLTSIRANYPNASIICTLGSMDITRKGSKWPGYIESAAAELSDPKIYTHFMPYKNTYGHPRIDEQKDMSENLIKFIDDNISW